MREGKWRLGNGFTVPLNHQNWFSNPHLNLYHPSLPTSTVGHLIDQNSTSRRADLVRVVYPFPLSTEILQIPLSKTGSVQDKLLWKFSSDGDYKVKDAYEMLMTDSSPPRIAYQQEGVWNLIWGVKVPLKINTFIWKLTQDRLPTLLNLSNRGITN